MLNGQTNNPYIYLLTYIKTGKQYVGKSCNNQPYYFSGGKIIRKIVSKYGQKVFDRKILTQGDFSNELLNELEKHYIQLYNTRSPVGYNLT